MIGAPAGTAVGIERALVATLQALAALHVGHARRRRGGGRRARHNENRGEQRSPEGGYDLHTGGYRNARAQRKHERRFMASWAVSSAQRVSTRANGSASARPSP